MPKRCVEKVSNFELFSLKFGRISGKIATRKLPLRKNCIEKEKLEANIVFKGKFSKLKK